MADRGGVAGERLKSFIERIERLEEEKRALSADIKEVYSEAKGAGFDIKTIREIIKIRRMDEDDLDEREALLDTYKRALELASRPIKLPDELTQPDRRDLVGHRHQSPPDIRQLEQQSEELRIVLRLDAHRHHDGVYPRLFEPGVVDHGRFERLRRITQMRDQSCLTADHAFPPTKSIGSHSVNNVRSGARRPQCL